MKRLAIILSLVFCAALFSMATACGGEDTQTHTNINGGDAGDTMDTNIDSPTDSGISEGTDTPSDTYSNTSWRCLICE